MEKFSYASQEKSSFDPDLYPRSYRWRGISAIMARIVIIVVFSCACTSIFRLLEGSGGQPLGEFLEALFQFALLAAFGRSALPLEIELTATSISMIRQFSRTTSIQRQDVVRCDLRQTRWGPRVMIEYRRSGASQVTVTGKTQIYMLPELDWDDEFWNWFDGVPGKRPKPAG
ncbi:hypothetical protein DWU98_19400 [Dyella monticola]|uniref:Uncharacterized protein n=1 Tax=Dyella monticola TaxID=1927958 RepID=A0A370WSM3_9GAMM|nr:hypothetical protein [Dyella monticola]RDS79169.1 hypothetical protein DWU98_19400 [Dyella monticola]